METNEQRLDRLHRELAHLYRSGVTDPVRLNAHWARIDKLESALSLEQIALDRASNDQ